MSCTRRDLLLGTATVLAGGVWLTLLRSVAGFAPGLRAGGVPPAAPARSDPTQRLAALLGEPVHAAAVGRAYLEAYPDERSLPGLVGALCAEHPMALRAGPAAPLKQSVSKAVRRDFARRDIVKVRGWILSRTEARLAAVSALAC